MFEKMAEAAERDAEQFWPNAALYALERKVAAEVWREADALWPRPEGDGATYAERRAEELAEQADQEWRVGRPVVAAKLRMRANTWRRVARMVQGDE